jgi:hypothetical protein
LVSYMLRPFSEVGSCRGDARGDSAMGIALERKRHS